MDALERYVREMSTPQGEALSWVERQSWLRTSHGRQVSGPEVGALLRQFVQLLRPRQVLEIGTFSGYSTLWMASALPEGGRIDTLEINDEMEDLIRAGFARAGLADRIRLHIGDALDILPALTGPYELVFIDADKRDYVAYYQAVFDLVAPGGLIVADNVLWDGKVCAEEPPRDQQTRGILAFNDLVAGDTRVDNFILPLRDGLNIIRKK
ncbi:MAG: O-methyltransferase [Bacteroidales bacterium]|nr:O-methyltransferase [Bacteroidales bacterium]